MKYLVLLFLLSSCTTVSYESRHGDVTETYSMTTFFKRVEDVSVVRTPDLFGLSIGSTSNDDVFSGVAKILEFYANPIPLGG